MEDVLDLYAEPCDPSRPAICFDATSTPLLADARGPLPTQAGRPRRDDPGGTTQAGRPRRDAPGGTPQAAGQRVSTRWRPQPLPVLRTAGWLAPHRHHGAARQAGLRSPDARAGGRGLPPRPRDQVGPGNLNMHRMAALYQTFHLLKLAGLCNASSFTTPPNTPVG